MMKLKFLTAVACLTVSTTNLAGQRGSTMSLSDPDRFDTPFSFVAAVRELSNGGLYVADPLEQAIYRLDWATGTTTRIGRVGSGPGEYLRPRVLLGLANDTTLVFDPAQGRYLTINPDGSIGNTFLLGDGARTVRSTTPRGVDRNGRIYLRYGDGGNITFGGSLSDSATVFRYDRGMDSLERVASILVGTPKNIPVGQPVVTGSHSTRMIIAMPQPYRSLDAWGVRADGTLAIARTGANAIEWIAPDGSVTRGVEFGWERGRPSRSDKRAFLQAWKDEQASDGHGGDLEQITVGMVEWPDSKPSFLGGASLVSPRGNMWLRTSFLGEPERYTIISPDGSSSGQVELARDTRLVGFGAESLYTALVDEDGLNWLRRHRLPNLVSKD